MPDDLVQPFSVHLHAETARPPVQPVGCPATPAPASTPADSAQPPPESSAVATAHSNRTSHAATDTTPSKAEAPHELAPAESDMVAHVLQLVHEYSQHDAAVPIGVGIAVIAILFRLFSWSQWLIGVLGVLVGVFGSAFVMFASPESSTLRRSATLAKFGHGLFQHNSPAEQLTATTCSESLKFTANKETIIQRYERVNIASDIDPMVEQMITYFLRDFVNVPVGLTPDGEHNSPLRASLATMFMNLSKKLSGMRLPETPLLGVFGLQNNFIVHLRAYREMRDSRMPIEDYVAKHANANSVLGRCYSKDERLKQYRSIAKAVCQSLLAKDDQLSVALFAVLQEIMATHVIGATLDHMCDPDYVNQMIVDYFTEKPVEQATASLTGDVRTHGPDHDAPITALADSILTNAASLMGQRQLESTPDAADPILSSNGSDSGNPDDHQLKEGSGLSRMATPATTAALVSPTTTPHAKAGHTGSDYAPNTRKDALGNFVRPVTLRDVIIHRDQHAEVYQEFMQYLQVWDAMDLVQFYVMMDLYHRQIHEGVLTTESELGREATRIFDMFCNSGDQDCQVPGLKQAQNGALYKNLARKVRYEPATCFHEAQGWAYQTLERQYWQPWQMTRTQRSPSDVSNGSSRDSLPSQSQSFGEPGVSSRQGLCIDNQRIKTSHEAVLAGQAPGKEALAVTSSPPPQSPSTETPLAAFPSAGSSPALSASSPSPGVQLTQSSIQKTSSIASIHLTDLINQRPKTLLSNQDLMYMVEIQAENGHGYMVSRTYQQLEQLHTSLVTHYPAVQRASFPRWRLQTSDKVCHGLESYLQSMLSIPEIRDSPRFGWFLSKDYDQSPDGTFPDDLANSPQDGGGGSPNSQLLANNVFSANLSGAGNAAAKNAKMAFKQASDASMAVGSFFKNLGGQIGSVIVTDEDRTPGFFRNSSESQRSTNGGSLQSHSTVAGQGAPMAPSLRTQPLMRNLARTASSESVQSVQSTRSFMSQGSTVVDPTLSRQYSASETAVSNGSPLNPFSSSSRRSTVDEGALLSDPRRGALVDAALQPSQDYNPWSDSETPRRRGTLDGQDLRPPPPPLPPTAITACDSTQPGNTRRPSTMSQDEQSDRTSISTAVSVSESSDKPFAVPLGAGISVPNNNASTTTKGHHQQQPVTAPMHKAATTATMPAPSSVAPSAPSTTAKAEESAPMALLSGDELDLLIETTFTVLEDMLDFTRGQALRRMTFGMLRELVRKSYRTAINQSFSEWAVQTTSHAHAVELVRWMKDDFFWPNGEWPVATVVEDVVVVAKEEKVDDYTQDGGGGGASASASAAAAGGGGGGEPRRTDEEKAATREEARRLMRRALPASMVAVLGKDACVRAMTDVFEMLQIRELNLGLAMSVFEMVVRLVLTK